MSYSLQCKSSQNVHQIPKYLLIILFLRFSSLVSALSLIPLSYDSSKGLPMDCRQEVGAKGPFPGLLCFGEPHMQRSCFRRFNRNPHSKEQDGKPLSPDLKASEDGLVCRYVRLVITTLCLRGMIYKGGHHIFVQRVVPKILVLDFSRLLSKIVLFLDEPGHLATIHWISKTVWTFTDKNPLRLQQTSTWFCPWGCSRMCVHPTIPTSFRNWEILQKSTILWTWPQCVGKPPPPTDMQKPYGSTHRHPDFHMRRTASTGARGGSVKGGSS